jgi:histone H2B
VLKQVHPDTGISAKAMAIMDSMVKDLRGRLFEQAKLLCEKSAKKSLDAGDLQVQPQPASQPTKKI